MKDKVDRLARIERLRRRMHEMSAWRLGVVAREREKLIETQNAMIDALGEGLMAFGPASVAGTRRVRAIAQELAMSAVVEKNLAKKALDDGRLAKLAGSQLDIAREMLREKTDRKSLEELVEASISHRSASHKP